MKIKIFTALMLLLTTHVAFSQLTANNYLFFNQSKNTAASRNWAIRQNDGVDGALQFGFINTNTGGNPTFLGNPGLAQVSFLPGGVVGIACVPSKISNLEVQGDATIFRAHGSQFTTATPLDLVNLGLQGGTGAMNFTWRVGYPYASGVNGIRMDAFKVVNGNTILATSENGAPLGRVGIGTMLTNAPTTDPYQLYVKGGIRTEEVKIDIASQNSWADYVFKPSYKLMPLPEVEMFIKANGHLPDVPSAADVVENGYNVSDMNATLLKKIEELTLYMIELKKENQEIKESNAKLEKKLAETIANTTSK